MVCSTIPAIRVFGRIFPYDIPIAFPARNVPFHEMPKQKYSDFPEQEIALGAFFGKKDSDNYQALSMDSPLYCYLLLLEKQVWKCV